MLLRYVAVLAILLWCGVALAQSDLDTKLVGKWQGDLADSKYGKGAGAPPSGRTLIIRSMTKTEQKWTIDAIYGITGRPLAPVVPAVDESGAAPTIQFMFGPGSQVTLRLIDAKNLVGTVKSTGGVMESRDLRLTKE